MDAAKKRIVEDGEFVQVNVDIDPPACGRTGAFSKKKHRYYTVKGLEKGFKNITPRIRQLLEKLAEISRDETSFVPYAFIDNSLNRRSIDAGCLAAIGPRYQGFVDYYMDGDYIVGVIPRRKMWLLTGDNSITSDLHNILSDPALALTEREALVAARVGQGKFRKDVLSLWNSRCAVTGSALLEVIRASHIRPWRDSDNQQRLDPENGLPLVATLDALFDRGIISFASSGKLLVNERKLSGEAFHLDGFQGLKNRLSEKSLGYLSYHRHMFGFGDS